MRTVGTHGPCSFFEKANVECVHIKNEPRHENLIFSSAYQLRGHLAANQHICFHYSTSSLLLLLNSPLCVRSAS